MNINEMPPPPIKPTKLPKIVKDQEKEAYFAAGQTLGANLSTHNPNAQPNKGGLLHNVSKYLEEQNRLANLKNQNARLQAAVSGNKLRGKKKGNPTWGIIIVVIWIMFAVIGSVQDEIADDFNSTTNDITSNSSLSETPGTSLSQPVLTTQETSCISIDVPEGMNFELPTSATNECIFTFGLGNFSNTWATSTTTDGSYVYADADEFLDALDLPVVEQLEINGYDVYKLEYDRTDSQDEYLFWIRDLEKSHDTNFKIDAVTIVLQKDGRNYEADTPQRILNSINFNSESIE